MKQVIQSVSGGPVAVVDVPRPTVGPTEVLVRTEASIISPGTERAVTALAQSSLLSKARARPDLVRQVVRKARNNGLVETINAVRSRLADDLPLGYSAAGTAVEVGSAVCGVRPGQLVATGGASKANHAEYQAVPGLLCVAVPAGVAAEDAAFATIASIALHALRLAEVGPGAKVVVLGMGLVGQLAARLAAAAGCDVLGLDVREVNAGAASGIATAKDVGAATTARVWEWSRGRGADAVLICAASPSSAAAARTPELCRDRARVVIVGDVGLQLDRTPYYERELSLHFARSYGPGRYDQSYEGWGVDYPAGYVRWTEGRNLEAVLDLISSGRLQVGDLVTHRFGIEKAAKAYELIERRTEPYLAIQLTYDHPDRPIPKMVRPTSPKIPGRGGIGWIGTGAFSGQTLLPAFRDAGFERLVGACSASGISARRVAERHGFERAVDSPEQLFDDPTVDVIVVATPHDSHADLVVRALNAGKHVWCEKPVALSEEELDRISDAWARSGRQLAIGYNRRWSAPLAAARQALADMPYTRMVTYRVAAGPVPAKHWYRDRRQGGRLLGEGCHFVDSVQALVGHDITHVSATSGGNASELLASDDFVVMLRFAEGSLATIAYSSATPAAGKERIEILSGSRRVLVDDYQTVEVDGKRVHHGRRDKGHRQLAAAFRMAIAGGEPLPTTAMLATSRATLVAAQTLSFESIVENLDGLSERS